MDMSCLGCCDDFLIRRIQPAIPDIFHDRSGEQPGILQYHTKHFPQLLAVEVPHIMPVDPDTAFIDIVITHQQLDHCRLTGSGRTYDRDLLSILYLCRKVVNDQLIRIIAKCHVVKCHISVQAICRCRMIDLLILLLFLKEFKYTLGCGSCRLQHICHLRDLLDRLRKIPDVLEEGLDISDLNRIFDDEESAKNRHYDISQIADELHDRHHNTGEELRLPS